MSATTRTRPARPAAPEAVSRRAWLGLIAAWVSADIPAQTTAEGGTGRVSATPTVAAASDLKFALEAVADGFAKAGGRVPRLVFGSSGHFYAQILQGAPFRMFMSADEDYVFRLAEAGLARDRGVLYAIGMKGDASAFPVFFASFLFLFAATGVGNASTFRWSAPSPRCRASRQSRSSRASRVG